MAIHLHATSLMFNSALAHLSRFPNLIENFGGKGGFVLRQETAIVLSNRVRRILNGIAGLLIGAGLLQYMRRQYIPDVVRPVR